jgi:hypothetical protein
VAAFIAALMIGRTPEYLGKKISTLDMQFAIFALLVPPALVRFSVLLKPALDSLGAAGPHGLSEIIYAYASSAADNGSAFAGLNANTPWYNVTTAIAMFVGRVAHAIPILAIAGSLAAKKKAKPSARNRLWPSCSASSPSSPAISSRAPAWAGRRAAPVGARRRLVTPASSACCREIVSWRPRGWPGRHCRRTATRLDSRLAAH